MSEVIFHIAPKKRPWHFRQRDHTLFSGHPEPEPALCDCLNLYCCIFWRETWRECFTALVRHKFFQEHIWYVFFFVFCFFTFSIQSLVFFSSFSLLHPFPRVIFSLRSPISLCVYLTQLSFDCHSGNQSFKCHLPRHITDHSMIWRKRTALDWPVPTLFFPLFAWHHYESSPLLLLTDTPIPRNNVCHTS